MGLLDFLQTPGGQALASGVATYAATARRGTPINNIGRGLMGGMQGYTGAIQGQRDAELQKQKHEYNKRQQDLLEMHYGNEGLKVANERQKLMDARLADEEDGKFAKVMWDDHFRSQGYDPETLQPMKIANHTVPSNKNLYSDILPTGNMAPDNVYIQESTVNPMLAIYDELGILPGHRKFYDSQIKADPKSAAKNLQKQYETYYKSQKQGTKEAKDAIAKERAMAEAMDMTLGDYLRETKVKQPLVDMRGASFGGNASLPSAGEAANTAGREFGKLAMEAVQVANSAYDVANDIQIVEQGLRGMGGGPVAEFKAWAGKIMPGDSEWGKMASMNDLAKTIQVKLAPTMRAAGSGATSDFEMKAFMAAIPSLSTTERGRSLMARYAQRIADRAQIRAEIVNELGHSGILPTPRQIADRMKARLGDRFFDDKDKAFFGIQSAPQQARPATAKPASSSGGWKDM